MPAHPASTRVLPCLCVPTAPCVVSVHACLPVRTVPMWVCVSMSLRPHVCPCVCVFISASPCGPVCRLICLAVCSAYTGLTGCLSCCVSTGLWIQHESLCLGRLSRQVTVEEPVQLLGCSAGPTDFCLALAAGRLAGPRFHDLWAHLQAWIVDSGVGGPALLAALKGDRRVSSGPGSDTLPGPADRCPGGRVGWLPRGFVPAWALGCAKRRRSRRGLGWRLAGRCPGVWGQGGLAPAQPQDRIPSLGSEPFSAAPPCLGLSCAVLI